MIHSKYVVGHNGHNGHNSCLNLTGKYFQSLIFPFFGQTKLFRTNAINDVNRQFLNNLEPMDTATVYCFFIRMTSPDGNIAVQAKCFLQFLANPRICL